MFIILTCYPRTCHLGSKGFVAVSEWDEYLNISKSVRFIDLSALTFYTLDLIQQQSCELTDYFRTEFSGASSLTCTRIQSIFHAGLSLWFSFVVFPLKFIIIFYCVCVFISTPYLINMQGVTNFKSNQREILCDTRIIRLTFKSLYVNIKTFNLSSVVSRNL